METQPEQTEVPLVTWIFFGCLGSLFGAILLICLTLGYHALIFPQLFKDGQYFLIPMIAFPVGLVLGSTTIIAIILNAMGETVKAKRWMIWGASISLALHLWMIIAFIPTLLWSLTLLYFGLRKNYPKPR